MSRCVKARKSEGAWSLLIPRVFVLPLITDSWAGQQVTTYISLSGLVDIQRSKYELTC